MIIPTVRSFPSRQDGTGDLFAFPHDLEVHCPHCGRWHALEMRRPAGHETGRSGSLFWLCGRLWYFAGHVGSEPHLPVRRVA